MALTKEELENLKQALALVTGVHNEADLSEGGQRKLHAAVRQLEYCIASIPAEQ